MRIAISRLCSFHIVQHFIFAAVLVAQKLHLCMLFSYGGTKLHVLIRTGMLLYFHILTFQKQMPGACIILFILH